MNNNNENGEKKKLTPYEIFRRIMLYVCILAFVAASVLLVKHVADYIEARKMTSIIIDGMSGITKPPSEEIIGGDPVIKDTSTENDPNEKDPEYSEYFLQCLEEIRKMKAQYPDFVGYIQIEGLDILYPIVQGKDNEYYLNHLINGALNQRGEIYMDFRNDRNSIYNNRNVVMYGHNLIDGTKFHNLLKYKDAENFNNCPITVITEEGIFTFTPFSFYQATSSDMYDRLEFPTDGMFKGFCDIVKALSMHKSDIEFTGKETIITLSTCVTYGSEKRWSLHAVLTDVSH